MSAPGGSSSSSRSIPFKSKKRLMDSPCSKSQPANPNPSPKSVPTPNKMFTRSRNQSVALSVKEIRQAAGSRSRSEDPVVKVSSAKTKLVFSLNDSSSSSPSKRTNKNAKKETLPEKYETLGNFFDAMNSSITLSRLKGSKPTFLKISAKIEELTDRRFSYSHLAQLKHILPEAIEIKKVLIYDERTSCMKPDLLLSLNADAVEYNEISKSESKKLALRKIFRARLADFVKAHPQGDEVPEEPLPLCYKRTPDNNLTVQVMSVSCSLMEEMASIPAAKLISSVIQVPSSLVKTALSPAKPVSLTSTPAKPTFSEMNMASTPVKQVSTTSASVPSTPVNSECKPVIAASTPPQFASTPVRMFSTASRLKKRGSSHTIQNDVSTADPPVKLARRSMNFDSYTDEEKATDMADDEAVDQLPEEDVVSDDEILSILPDKLRQSIIEQERKAIEDSDPAISQAKRRLKMISRLPKLFNVMHYLIQSIRRWVITKEELVHKIISGHSDITDRKELEEQLILMQELVPEWISEKRSSCGGLLVCINKLASPQTIRSRLEEENKKALAPPLS